MTPPQPTLAVVGVSQYRPQSGVGRVLHSLLGHWRGSLKLEEAHFISSPLPLLRNLPRGVRAPTSTSLVLLPQLTGAEALRRTGGLPSLVIVHDVGVMDFPGDREGRSRLSHTLVRRSFRGLARASHIVTVSEFSRTRLLHHTPALQDKVTAIPSGVEDTFLGYTHAREAARQRAEALCGGLLGAPLLVYVGSEIKRKNIPLLLETFCRVRARYPQAQLLKVGGAGGEGWRRATLELLHTYHLSPGREVILLEGVGDAQLADLYRAADVFLSASLYEGFGLPALEAMAVGTPAVVTDRASFPEITQGAGWAVAPRAEALAQGVFEALGARNETKNKAWAQQFGWAAAAARYLDLMYSLMDAYTPLASGQPHISKADVLA